MKRLKAPYKPKIPCIRAGKVCYKMGVNCQQTCKAFLQYAKDIRDWQKGKEEHEQERKEQMRRFRHLRKEVSVNGKATEAVEGKERY